MIVDCLVLDAFQRERGLMGRKSTRSCRLYDCGGMEGQCGDSDGIEGNNTFTRNVPQLSSDKRMCFALIHYQTSNRLLLTLKAEPGSRLRQVGMRGISGPQRRIRRNTNLLIAFLDDW